jgi:hypothetical protein
MSFTGSTFGRFTGRYMIIMGIFFLVLGGAFVLVLGGIPYAGGGMLLTGGIFIIVGGALAVIGFMVNRGAGSTDNLLATGVSGTATLTGVTQTGMYLNEQPRIKMDMLVQLPGQLPYAAEHSEFVPLILLSRVQPGATLPVRVNPAQPAKVVIDWQGLSAMGMPGIAMAGAAPMNVAAPVPGMAMAAPGAMTAPPPAMAGPGSGMDESLAQVQAALAGSGAAVPAAFATPDQAGYTVEQLRAWLRANGVDAQAHVDFLEDTGKVVGDERLFTMEMTLMVPGASPEKLERSAAMVPMAASARLRLGMTLPVKVAAENHHLLTIEWEKV